MQQSKTNQLLFDSRERSALRSTWWTAAVDTNSSIFEETKEDKERVIDPKLLFPVKEWLLSWLPGHSFKWDFEEEEEAKLRAEDEFEENVPIHQEVWEEKNLQRFCTIYPYRLLL